MTVRLTRTAGGTAPQFSGVEVDDGFDAFAWQTTGHRVGRFARSLTSRVRRALERALAAAAETEPVAPPDLRPGGVVEQVIAEGIDLVLDAHASPPVGVGDLVGLLRGLHEDLADTPVAAIELEVEPAGSSPAARLRHVGKTPLTLRMTSPTLQATVFDADSAVLDSASVTVEASLDEPVGAGWTLPLADSLGVPAPVDDGFLTVIVGPAEVDVLGDGVLRRAEFGWMSE